MTDLKKLLPCPFCGGGADIEEVSASPFEEELATFWAIGCKECNIGWYEEDKSKAITKWNCRAECDNFDYQTGCKGHKEAGECKE